MRVVLLTTTGCKPCSQAKDYLQPQIDTGEIEVLDVQKSDEAANLVAKHGFKGVPKLLVLRADGTPFSELQITDTEMLIEQRR
jgi:glutaredoxin